MASASRYARDWRNYVAVGLGVAVLASASARLFGPRQPDIGHRASGAPHYNYTVGGSTCDPNYLSSLPYNSKSAAKRDSCEEAQHKEQLEQSTLAESARQADASEQAVLISNYQAWSGFWQTFATIGAFLAAILAAIYAHRAAREAERAADTAITTLHNQRPWLMSGPRPGLDRISSGTWNGTPFVGVRLSVPIKNLGLTLANDIYYEADQDIFEAVGDVEPSSFYMRNLSTFVQPAAPGDVPSYALIWISDNQLIRMRQREMRAFMFFRLNYAGVFTEKRFVSQYCFEVIIEAQNKTATGQLNDIFALRPVEHFTRIQ